MTGRRARMTGKRSRNDRTVAGMTGKK